MNLYERLFRYLDIIYKIMLNKFFLVVVCVYIKMCENDFFVLFCWFCKVLGICVNDFLRNFLFVFKCMDIKLNYLSIELEIDIVLEFVKLGLKVMNFIVEII